MKRTFNFSLKLDWNSIETEELLATFTVNDKDLQNENEINMLAYEAKTYFILTSHRNQQETIVFFRTWQKELQKFQNVQYIFSVSKMSYYR
jgi:hypothetical protein